MIPQDSSFAIFMPTNSKSQNAPTNAKYRVMDFQQHHSRWLILYLNPFRILQKRIKLELELMR